MYRCTLKANLHRAHERKHNNEVPECCSMQRAYQKEEVVEPTLKASALHIQSIHELQTSATVLGICCTAVASWLNKVNVVYLCTKAIWVPWL